jgi:hypothetical protein
MFDGTVGRRPAASRLLLRVERAYRSQSSSRASNRVSMRRRVEMRRLSVALAAGFAAIAAYACGSSHDQGGGSNQMSSSGSSSGASSGSGSGKDASIEARPDPNSMFNGAIGKGAYWLQNTSLKVQPTTAPGPLDGEIDI